MTKNFSQGWGKHLSDNYRGSITLHNGCHLSQIHIILHEFQRKALIRQQNDRNMIQRASYMGSVLVLD